MYYPIFLDNFHIHCCVIGGGAVAQRKVETLCKVKARVRVVSPTLTKKLQSMAERGAFEWIAKKYESKFLKDVNLVIGATSDYLLNQRIYRDCVAKNIFVNIVDEPRHCSFIVPAQFRSADITVAVSTAGCAPLVCSMICEEVRQNLGPAYPRLVAWLKSHRDIIKTLPQGAKRRFWLSIKRLDIHRFDKHPKDIAIEAQNCLEDVKLRQTKVAKE